MVVGCSHPGVEKILEGASRIDPRIYTVTGGFHLVMTPPDEIKRVTNILYDMLKIKRVAPGRTSANA